MRESMCAGVRPRVHACVRLSFVPDRRSVIEHALVAVQGSAHSAAHMNTTEAGGGSKDGMISRRM